MDILSINNIDELAMKFNANMKFALKWHDQRITFKNLAENGNFLDKSQQKQIWLPPLIFSNTDELINLSSGDFIGVKILRQNMSEDPKPLPNDLSELNEGTTYKGVKNELFLFAHHQYRQASLSACI